MQGLGLRRGPAAALATLASMCAAACSGGEDPVRCGDWTLGFAAEELEERAALIEVAITRGGCDSDGEVVYRAELEAVDGAMGPPPASLEPGAYALRAHARDDDCNRYAQGCTPVQLPCGSGESVHVELAAAVGSTACSPSQCHAGRCRMDAGTADAGADADAGVDAGFDAGTDAGPSCPDDLVPCGSDCVDTATDPAHCGDCGNDCAEGELCSDRACQTECEAGHTACGGSCVDTATNDSHCGGCDNACPTVQQCRDGACQCPAGCSGCLETGCGETTPCQCDPGCTCSFECIRECQFECQADSVCTVDAREAASGTSSAACHSGADCTVDARGATGFLMECDEDGTSCVVDCTGAGGCAVYCRDGARCLLECGTDGECGFVECDGAQQSCGGGVVVCNRDCP